MTGSVDHVSYAVIVFVCIHILSSTTLRAFVVGRVGERVITTGFSLLSGAAFLWLLLAYAAAPFEAGWTPPPALKWAPLIIMPLAFILLVTSLTTPNPAMAGGDRALESGTTAIGIMTITRHPLFWSIALWGISHLLARGDLATIWMAGGMTVLALAGMPLQDRKKMQIKGAL
ncbi:MAG: NnrU family protein [Rhodospirillaceae bacterium]|nr:NnrU family protein [Rhodospirillaceae bacterium]